MRILSKAADALLFRFMPKAQAEAGCPAETLYQYKCIGTVQYRRTGRVQTDCTVVWGSWVRIGTCPV